MIAFNEGDSDFTTSDHLELDQLLDIFSGAIPDSLTYVWDEVSKSNIDLNDQLDKTQPSK